MKKCHIIIIKLIEFFYLSVHIYIYTCKNMNANFIYLIKNLT